ncbi:MAG: ferrous iron transport protein B [bacterium]
MEQNNISESKNIRIALAGNPNSGKSTIFNILTGGDAHIGNWPGVTVEKKEGRFSYKDYEVSVTDLPGIYSFISYSIDERIARDFIIKEKPDVVVCIADATNLMRNLYLCVLFRELGVNAVLDLNMFDLIESKYEINLKKMEELLGIPVVATSGKKRTGIDELKETIVKAATLHVEPLHINYGDSIEQVIKKIESVLDKGSLPYSKRFTVLSLLQGDPQVVEDVKKAGLEEALESVQTEVINLETKFSLSIETEIVEKRYGFIESVIKQSVKRIIPVEEKISISDKIDKVVINRYLGIPIFALFMWITFDLTFKVGGFFADYFKEFFDWLGNFLLPYLEHAGAGNIVSSFVKDGLIGGVGTVITFLPNILIMFLFLSFLEDVGYMARAAFVMDRTMHAIGLPGRSFIPMILGFGCNVPAIMATRTISDDRDRLLTILINPFMSCTARLPIYVLLTTLFFKDHHPGLVIFSLYALGVFVGILSAKLFRTTIPSLKGKVSPLVMELPPYRMPSIKGVWIHTWERGSLFLKKAGTIIFAGVILIWLLASIPFSQPYAGEGTVVGYIGKAIAPILKPAGFGFWQAGVALIFGLLAKETVVGTLGTLFGSESNLPIALSSLFTPLSSYAFMVMSLLYIPCIASIGVIYRETGSLKWTTFSVLYSLFVGWVVSVIVYQVGSLINVF